MGNTFLVEKSFVAFIDINVLVIIVKNIAYVI